MIVRPSTGASVQIRGSWNIAIGALTRPYRVTLPMLLLVALVPAYLVIARRSEGVGVFTPAVVVDGWIPLQPSWSLVYGALYAVLIVLPVLVVQQPEMIRRTVWAYVTVWVVSYGCFWLYPTVAPRPDAFAGDGFGAWGLRFLYDADPPYNCFPSIHVAHSFVSAFACSRVHRRLGLLTIICAGLVSVSTLLTKQHYVADVVAGAGLAFAADAACMRGFARESIPESDRRAAPVLAVCASAMAAGGLGIYFVAYLISR
jgi:membrane-associated phospholipid phosphatase